MPDASALVHAAPAQRGDCPLDPADDALITLVVSSRDAVTPVDVTYPVFRTDGTRLVRRMTQPGPVITVLLGACGAGAGAGGAMQFVATTGTGTIACALFVGGDLIAADDGDRRAECAAGRADGVPPDGAGE